MARKRDKSGTKLKPTGKVRQVSARQSKTPRKTTSNQYTKPTDKRDLVNLTHEQVAAWQLLTCGYSSEVVGQMLGVSAVTVRQWKMKIVKEFAEMPSIRAAIDRTMTMVPKALGVVDKAMDGIDIPLPGYRAVAYAAAKDVLTANRIFADRMILTDDRTKSDSELVAEANRIMAEAQKQLEGAIANATGDA